MKEKCKMTYIYESEHGNAEYTANQNETREALSEIIYTQYFKGLSFIKNNPEAKKEIIETIETFIKDSDCLSHLEDYFYESLHDCFEEDAYRLCINN